MKDSRTGNGDRFRLSLYLLDMSISHWSIRNQILLLVAIVAIPAIGIIISSGVNQRAEAIHEARVETQKLVETIVNDQKNQINATRQLSVALAQLPQLRERKRSELESILNDILKVSPQYSNIFVVSPSGRVWASGIPINEEEVLVDARFFKNAVKTGDFSSGEYHLPSYSENPSLSFGYPVLNDEGILIGVIGVGLSFNFEKLFNSYSLPEGASFALFDHRGTVLARAVEPEKYVGTSINSNIFQQMQDGPNEATSIGKSSIVGDKRIQTYRKITLPNEYLPYLYLRVGIPLKPLMEQSQTSFFRNLMLYSLSLGFGLFLSWFIGKKLIVDRIKYLQQASYSLANGDIETRVAQNLGGGEIGELGRAFDDMAQKLAIREKSLQESEKLKEEMFSNLSHEMRTPLTGMLGFLEYVTKNEIDPKQLQEYLHVMHREGERLSDLVSNFLDMQRLKTKIEILEFQPIDAKRIITEVINLFSISSKKISIINKISDSLPPIAGESSLIHQALNNILSNAIKYSPYDAEVVVDAKLNGGMVSFYVQDQGVGIPPELHEKVFDPFYRVEEKGMPQIKGTGLGLALVKRIADAHSGKVRIDSARGCGTTFVFSVPVFSGKSFKSI